MVCPAPGQQRYTSVTSLHPAARHTKTQRAGRWASPLEMGRGMVARRAKAGSALCTASAALTAPHHADAHMHSEANGTRDGVTEAPLVHANELACNSTIMDFIADRPELSALMGHLEAAGGGARSWQGSCGLLDGCRLARTAAANCHACPCCLRHPHPLPALPTSSPLQASRPCWRMPPPPSPCLHPPTRLGQRYHQRWTSRTSRRCSRQEGCAAHWCVAAQCDGMSGHQAMQMR